jgi:nitrate/nitrite transport system permease protein
MKLDTLNAVLLPLAGIGSLVAFWAVLSATVSPDLPSPLQAWEESKRYVLEPFFKEGEMNQGIGRLAFYGLVRAAKGYLLAIAIGTPLGFVLGLSRTFVRRRSRRPGRRAMQPRCPSCSRAVDFAEA